MDEKIKGKNFDGDFNIWIWRFEENLEEIAKRFEADLKEDQDLKRR